MTSQGEGDKRQQILKAAVKVFSQKGFHQAKVDEIAQLADVGKGTVYEYFSSKTELFQEMFKAGMQFYLENMKNELKPGLTCREKLTRIARLHVRFIVHYKDLAKVTLTEHSYFNEEFREWIWQNRANKLKLIEQVIAEGVAAGEFRKVDPKVAALTFSGTLGAMFSPIVFSDGNGSSKELVEPVLDLLFKGLVDG